MAGDARENHMVTAPWTDRQLANLVTWQHAGWTHSFTCPRCSEPGHFEIFGDHGGLQPGVYGWRCMAVGCDYTQKWAWDFMLEPTPPNPFEFLHEQAQAQANPEAEEIKRVAQAMRDLARNWGFTVCTKAAELIERLL